MRTYGTSETFNVTPSRIVNIIMLNMLVGMKDSNVKYVINDLAASQDKKMFIRIALWRIRFIVGSRWDGNVVPVRVESDDAAE